MNDTLNETWLDLGRYVDEVRRGLADLPEDVREELTDGLAADLAELVDERGSGSLPRPEEYAAELRASAGLPPAVRRPLLAPDWWRPGWDVAVAALPVWWVARAWVWVMLLHLLLWTPQEWGYDVPWLPTSSWGTGLLLWGAASVVSIQVGRGRVRPGRRDSVAAIVALVAIDVASVAGFAVAYDHMDNVLDTRAQAWDGADATPVNANVITYRGHQSCRLIVLDAQGHRLRHVTIENQSGQVLPQRNRRC